ncbi:MAG: hypothetical protein KGL35_24380 [Bradyrhizobium sp.]|nr:hypothetical protein [Bradyrhizobium sp.]
MTSVLPSGTPVVAMQVNRTPEPSADNFAVINQISRPRFATNVDSFVDATMTASIAGTVLTASNVTGALSAGLPLLGANVSAGSVLGDQLTGTPGGAGTYNVSPSQTLSAELVTAGIKTVQQKSEVVMQIDVHGSLSGDNSQKIATLFRDPYATTFFAGLGIELRPLYTDDPKQLPFINAEQQWETRYSMDIHFEANFNVTDIPQQFADQLTPNLFPVGAYYHP